MSRGRLRFVGASARLTTPAPPPELPGANTGTFAPGKRYSAAAGGPNRLFCPWQLISYRREQILVVLLPVSGFSFCRERETAILLLEICQKAMGKGIGKHRDGTEASLIRQGVSQQPILAGWETTSQYRRSEKGLSCSPLNQYSFYVKDGSAARLDVTSK